MVEGRGIMCLLFVFIVSIAFFSCRCINGLAELIVINTVVASSNTVKLLKYLKSRTDWWNWTNPCWKQLPWDQVGERLQAQGWPDEPAPIIRGLTPGSNPRVPAHADIEFSWSENSVILSATQGRIKFHLLMGSILSPDAVWTIVIGWRPPYHKSQQQTFFLGWWCGRWCLLYLT